MAILGIEGLQFKVDNRDPQLVRDAQISPDIEAAYRLLGKLGAEAALDSLVDELGNFPPLEWRDKCTIKGEGFLLARSFCIPLPLTDLTSTRFFGVVVPEYADEVEANGMHVTTEFLAMIEAHHGDVSEDDICAHDAGLIELTDGPDMSGYAPANGYLFTGGDRIRASLDGDRIRSGFEGYERLCAIVAQGTIDALEVIW